jgi:hypothetical protein
VSAQLSVAEELLSVGGRGPVEYCRVGDRPQEMDVERAAGALTAAATRAYQEEVRERKTKEQRAAGDQEGLNHLTWHLVVIGFPRSHT